MSNPELVISLETCQRWLEAGPYPFEWFCKLDEERQEALAAIGVDFQRARALAVAKAIQDPEGYETEHFGSKQDMEDLMAARLAQSGLERFLGSTAPDSSVTPPPPRPRGTSRIAQEAAAQSPPRTMAGELEAGRQAAAAEQEAQKVGLRSSLRPGRVS